MLFVIDKPEFQHAISIVRDDRTKRNQGQAGPFMRLEAQDDYAALSQPRSGTRSASFAFPYRTRTSLHIE